MCRNDGIAVESGFYSQSDAPVLHEVQELLRDILEGFEGHRIGSRTNQLHALLITFDHHFENIQITGIWRKMEVLKQQHVDLSH